MGDGFASFDMARNVDDVDSNDGRLNPIMPGADIQISA